MRLIVDGLKTILIILFSVFFIMLCAAPSGLSEIAKEIERDALKQSDFPDLSHDRLFPFSMLPTKAKDVAYENLANAYIELKESINKQPTKADVVGLIAKKSYEAGLDPIQSLQIAKAESGFDSLAKNKHSSAKGIYEFLDKTWENYCVGDVLNAEDNIDCFVELFPKHPGWWLTAKDY